MGIRNIFSKIMARLLLFKVSMNSTPEYALKGIQTVCKALDVYDGDTLWIAFVLGYKTYRSRVRMYGYDSPELKPRLDIPERAQVIERALVAKTRLQQLVNTNNLINVEFLHPDKYGRPLVKLTCNGVCINDQMVREGHGYPYFGGTKQNC